MNSYTADAYRAAAEIARRDGDGTLSVVASEWEEEAKRMERLGEYGRDLAEKVRSRTRYEFHDMSPEAWGMQLMAALLEDGWKAPEGLL